MILKARISKDGERVLCGGVDCGAKIGRRIYLDDGSLSEIRTDDGVIILISGYHEDSPGHWRMPNRPRAAAVRGNPGVHRRGTIKTINGKSRTTQKIALDTNDLNGASIQCYRCGFVNEMSAELFF